MPHSTSVIVHLSVAETTHELHVDECDLQQIHIPHENVTLEIISTPFICNTTHIKLKHHDSDTVHSIFSKHILIVSFEINFGEEPKKLK